MNHVLGGPPPPDPKSIRACLTAELARAFDGEWEFVLDQAKQSQDLRPVHDLLAKWRHIAFAELKDPGVYDQAMATATHALATSQAPEGSATAEEVEALLRARRCG
ncbi:DUF6247 family protein [Alloactinosynnema sp. L-07]|uniref:DUF6247 family protein n=1 Tax=Alloactinosynnema sp. L-07 TaxID=1653480 RepID=UPI0012FA0098|nr:DUF6247 family protein [Alloactinosynnema sp. L-07]